MSLQTHNQQIKTQDNGGTWVLARSTKVNGKESYFTDSVISLNLPEALIVAGRRPTDRPHFLSLVNKISTKTHFCKHPLVPLMTNQPSRKEHTLHTQILSGLPSPSPSPSPSPFLCLPKETSARPPQVRSLPGRKRRETMRPKRP